MTSRFKKHDKNLIVCYYENRKNMTGGRRWIRLSTMLFYLWIWQDTVTYEGCTMPAGTIGCEVLNVPDGAVAKLDTPCNVLNQLLQGMNTGSSIWTAAAGAASR